MPQSSEELRNYVTQRFGTLDCGKVLDFLKKRGYTEESGLIKYPPQREEEELLLNFLFEEWDFAVCR